MSSRLPAWHYAERLFTGNQDTAAATAYTALLADPDWVLPARLRLSVLAQRQGDLRATVEHALAAYAAREPDPVLLEALAKRLADVGELEAALAIARDPAIARCEDPQVLAGVGKLMLDQGLMDAALPLLDAARARGLDTPALDYLRGVALSYTDDVDAAEAALTRCLSRDAGLVAAWRPLVKLRRQTPERNPVDRLRAAVARLPADAPDAPPLFYALFKALDDLGDTEGAWAALAEGMRRRRAQVRFDPAVEQALFDELMRFTDGPVRAPVPEDDGPAPVFILGQPRSGTTLLERLLGAHPRVADAGELRDFMFQLRWTCERLGPHGVDPALAAAARGADFALLGQRYLSHTQWQARGHAVYTDKLPANFLLAGPIARALPQARLLHLVREPMDVCFSNLKELFADAYPHSYDQAEMAGHYRRYRSLLAHWHAAFPGRILDVHYDRLVTEPEAVAREVLAFCGLPWDPAVLAPDARGGTVATASAAQVREPIHARFLGQWRRYEAALQPLREALGPLAG